jgi:hypothetical protein
MLAMTLALGTSVCYGVSNFLGPQLARRHALGAGNAGGLIGFYKAAELGPRRSQALC